MDGGCERREMEMLANGRNARQYIDEEKQVGGRDSFFFCFLYESNYKLCSTWIIILISNA